MTIGSKEDFAIFLDMRFRRNFFTLVYQERKKNKIKYNKNFKIMYTTKNREIGVKNPPNI